MRYYSNSRKIYGFGSILLGILMLFWPAGILKLVAYVAGVIIMAGGIASVLSHFRGAKKNARYGGSLIIGVIVTLIGGWIFVNPENFVSIIPTAIGYLITFSGITNLIETFILSNAHYSKWWISLLGAVMTIIFGLILINHAFGIPVMIVRISGAALLFNGISDLWINRRVDQYSKNRRKGSRASGTAKSSGTAARGNARHDTSDPDIIDAENYREL